MKLNAQKCLWLVIGALVLTWAGCSWPEFTVDQPEATAINSTFESEVNIFSRN